MKFAKLMMAAVIAAGTLFVLTGCGESSPNTKDNPQKTNYNRVQESSAVKDLVCRLFNQGKRTGDTFVLSNYVTIEKIRQSPNDPDVYFAKAVSRREGALGMIDIKIEFVGDMVQVTKIE